MSCLANVDPYNNYPESKRGGPPPPTGGNAHTFTKGFDGGMAQRPRPPPRMNAPQAGQVAQTQQQPPDLESINAMLYADLQVAIGYIKHLGGTWPPPGH